MEKRKRGRPKKQIIESELITEVGVVIQGNTNLYRAVEFVWGFDEGLTTRQPLVGHFSTLKELLNLSWVKTFGRKGWGRFSISIRHEYNILMVENEHSTVWWALAKIPTSFEHNLPTWKLRSYSSIE